mmetsp:Transcript_33350/g.65968  ORF Transcript_33350/g.65968 Transcript_33350/m.65968 type:complete len:524 (+) Transcript_33350:698-2269(+)
MGPLSDGSVDGKFAQDPFPHPQGGGGHHGRQLEDRLPPQRPLVRPLVVGRGPVVAGVVRHERGRVRPKGVSAVDDGGHVGDEAPPVGNCVEEIRKVCVEIGVARRKEVQAQGAGTCSTAEQHLGTVARRRRHRLGPEPFEEGAAPGGRGTQGGRQQHVVVGQQEPAMLAGEEDPLEHLAHFPRGRGIEHEATEGPPGAGRPQDHPHELFAGRFLLCRVFFPHTGPDGHDVLLDGGRIFERVQAPTRGVFGGAEHHGHGVGARQQRPRVQQQGVQVRTGKSGGLGGLRVVTRAIGVATRGRLRRGVAGKGGHLRGPGAAPTTRGDIVRRGGRGARGGDEALFGGLELVETGPEHQVEGTVLACGPGAQQDVALRQGDEERAVFKVRPGEHRQAHLLQCVDQSIPDLCQRLQRVRHLFCLEDQHHAPTVLGGIHPGGLPRLHPMLCVPMVVPPGIEFPAVVPIGHRRHDEALHPVVDRLRRQKVHRVAQHVEGLRAEHGHVPHLHVDRELRVRRRRGRHEIFVQS